MIEKEVTWHSFEYDCQKLAKDIKDSNLKISTLIAIARGGLFVSGYLGHLLGINDIRVVCLKSYANKTQGNLECLFLSDFDPKTSLVVDDLVDTGRTLAYLTKLKNSELITSVLYYKRTSSYIPTFFAEKVDPDCWINFPWELQIKNEQTSYRHGRTDF